MTDDRPAQDCLSLVGYDWCCSSRSRPSFPFIDSLQDHLCKALVAELAHVGKDIVQIRAQRRRALSVAKRHIAPLTRDIRSLVSEFSAPINGSVDFGLLECLVRVCKWPHFWLVDLLIYGFQLVGQVQVSGFHRPVNEPSTESFRPAACQGSGRGVGH